MSTAETSDWLSTPPRGEWPDRSYRPAMTPPGVVEPATGREKLAAGELEELTEQLKEFAAFLYGTSLFRALYSLTPALAPDIRPRFAISAISGEQDHTFEYDPSNVRFDLLAQSAPVSGYAIGFECFASDLLDFLRGKLSPSALMFGRLLRWRSADVPASVIDHAIWLYGHPLRRPDLPLALYRDILGREPKDVVRVRGAS